MIDSCSGCRASARGMSVLTLMLSLSVSSMFAAILILNSKPEDARLCTSCMIGRTFDFGVNSGSVSPASFLESRLPHPSLQPPTSSIIRLYGPRNLAI